MVEIIKKEHERNPRLPAFELERSPLVANSDKPIRLMAERIRLSKANLKIRSVPLLRPKSCLLGLRFARGCCWLSNSE